jgi:hypothetical protein
MSPKLFQILRYIIHNTLEGFGDFKIRQAICTVKQADGLVLWLTKNCATGHDLLVLRCYRIEMNVEETGVMIAKELLTVHLKRGQK